MRKFTLFYLLLVLVLAVFPACGSDPVENACFEAVDGVFQSVPCSSGDVENGTDTAINVTLPSPSVASSSDDGLTIFIRESAPPCATCHAIDGVPFAVGQVGPNLTQIGSMQDADFIRDSIINPNAVIAETCPTGPCQPDVMPQNFGELLTEQQLDALVRYLSSLK